MSFYTFLFFSIKFITCCDWVLLIPVGYENLTFPDFELNRGVGWQTIESISGPFSVNSKFFLVSFIDHEKNVIFQH